MAVIDDSKEKIAYRLAELNFEASDSQAECSHLDNNYAQRRLIVSGKAHATVVLCPP